jgi:hypothetical protein
MMMSERKDLTDFDLRSKVNAEIDELIGDLEEKIPRDLKEVEKNKMLLVSLKGMRK